MKDQGFFPPMKPWERYWLPGSGGFLAGEMLSISPRDAVVPCIMFVSLILAEHFGYKHLAKTNDRYQSRLPDKDAQHITALLSFLSIVALNNLK